MMNRKGKRMNVVKAFCLFTLLGCFIGCKDDEEKKEQSFNNDLPIEIVGFEPQEVTSRTQLPVSYTHLPEISSMNSG